MTFDGIVEVCRRNIEDDFGNSPVPDLEKLRESHALEIHAHGETKRQLADAQKALKDAMDENSKLKDLANAWEQNAHDAGELYTEIEAECARKCDEVRKLKAEIFRMRLDRMTEADMANMYDKMKGENENE